MYNTAILPDYKKDEILINGTLFKMDVLREWLLRNHQTLCTNNFIKSIRSNHKTLRTYDWMAIIEIAQVSGYLNDFLKNQKNSCNNQLN